MVNYKRDNAFTLSETLITLGIIGIVASTTITILVNNIQEKHFHTMWKENFSILNNAFNMLKNEDPTLTWQNKETYELYLSYLNVVDVCNRENTAREDRCGYKASSKSWCGITNNASIYKTLAKGSLHCYDFGGMAALLNNGTVIYLGGSHSGHTIVVDVNAKKGPNIVGKDVYAISLQSRTTAWMSPISKLPFLPYGVDDVGRRNSTSTSVVGSYGCSTDIGAQGHCNYLYTAPGVGCSAKYLYEK